MNNGVEKNEYYALQIRAAIFNMFRDDEEQEPCHIDLKELGEADNAVEFFIGFLKAGTLIFNKFTDSNKNNLEFTHVLNQLCVQDLLKGSELLEEEE